MTRLDPIIADLTIDCLDAEEVLAIEPAQWDELATNALEDNPFYARQYVTAGLETIDVRADLQALAMWRGDGTLVGLLPLARRHGLPFPFAVAGASANLYQFSGTPLIHRDHAADVVPALAIAMAERPGLPRFWLLPNIAVDGPFAAALREAAGSRLQVQPVNEYRRPALTRHPEGFEAHCREAMSPKRRRELERNLRRLRDLGTLELERATAPAEIRARLEQFLAIEHAGWKGKAGTSFLADDDHAVFARLAFGGSDGRDGLAGTDTLLLDGKPIAISLNLFGGRTVFTPKCTYDETLRSHAPGLVLEYLVIEAFHRDGGATAMDAATTADGHVVSGLWNGDKAMAQLVIGPPDWRTDGLAGLVRQMHQLRETAKRLLKR